MPKRWTRRPEGSNWGDFGEDDQCGRLNLLTPEKLRDGIREVQENRSFCLSLPLDIPGGNSLNARRFPPVLRPTRRGDVPNVNYRLSNDGIDATDVINDDIAILHTHYSTHWDALGHIGQMFDADGDGVPELVYYNGFRAGSDIVGTSDVADSGAFTKISSQSTMYAHRLGIDRMAERCVQGRAVLIDLFAHLGLEHTAVSNGMLQDIMRQDGVDVEPGDIVCLHTGFAQALLDNGQPPSPMMAQNVGCALDGRDEALLAWIAASGLAALVADNIAVEMMPAVSHLGCCAALPLHEHCLFKLGIHLGEFWYLTELAHFLRSRGRSRFLLTAPPLRLPGAIGSPTTPVATV